MPTPDRIFSDASLLEWSEVHGTPLHVLSADRVESQYERLGSFDRVRYAQKANGNLALLRHLLRLGSAVDAVSAGEIARALAAGFAPEDIVYTSDVFLPEALELVERHGIHVNCGSEDMLAALGERCPGSSITLRLNPGFGCGHHRGVQTGGEASKHGLWFEDFERILERAGTLGLRVTGLHVHIGSGARLENLERTGDAVLTAGRLVGSELRVISAGGGLPVPYVGDEEAFDLERYGRAWQGTRDQLARTLGSRIELEVEPGRFLVAGAGLLLTRTLAVKRNRGTEYALVDSGFHNLPRVVLYGSHHGISVVGRDAGETRPRVIAGPLCESCDVFTQNREGLLVPRDLPPIEVGDLLCIHDTGAYVTSMASNYNSHPHPAELLVLGGEAHRVRRRQRLDEIWAQESVPDVLQ